MKIGKYFTLEELIKTNSKLVNVPSKAETENLRLLVENILDPLREKYGKPITVNSGYRSPIVNARVGGAKNSDHVKGMAADITAGSKEENKKLFEIIRDNFTFRQLINEYDYSWVHVSFNKDDNKKQILAIK
jgi:zinc D-Ala-D-Ala carboxypeptidase